MRFYEFFNLDPDATLKDLRRAYAKKIKTCRPEEDPDLFMTTREMYEAGCRYLASPTSDTVAVATPPMTPVPETDSAKNAWKPPEENLAPQKNTLFQQLEAHYNTYEARLDIASWQRFFTTLTFETYAFFPEVFDSFIQSHHAYTREIASFFLNRFETFGGETMEKLHYLESAPEVLDTFASSGEVTFTLFVDLYLSALGFEVDIDFSRLTALEDVVTTSPAFHYLAASYCIEKRCASLLEGLGDKATKCRHNMLGIESQLAYELNKPNRAYDLLKVQLRTVKNDANEMAAYWFKKRLKEEGQEASGPRCGNSCCFDLYAINDNKRLQLQSKGIRSFVKASQRSDRLSSCVIFSVLILILVGLFFYAFIAFVALISLAVVYIGLRVRALGKERQI
ncbi:J domain-containing protein [Fusibacter sp. JL298sf-3]